MPWDVNISHTQKNRIDMQTLVPKMFLNMRRSNLFPQMYAPPQLVFILLHSGVR